MWIWFGLAALALIGEVMTGTFYLLLVAAGLIAGGLASWADLAGHWQLVTAGVVALLGLAVMRLSGVLKKREIVSTRNADVNLDIGQLVQVEAWSTGRTAHVRYRGAQWQAVLAPDAPAAPGAHRIIEIVGAQLIVAPTGRETT